MMTDKEYHAHDSISRGRLADFAKSRRYYEARHVTGTVKPVDSNDKLCLKIGDAAHSILLQPDEFKRRVVPIPREALTSNGQRRGNKWDDWKEETLEATPDALLLLPAEVEHVQRIANAVSGRVGPMLRNPGVLFEEPILWTEDAAGISVPCRCKPDALYETKGGGLVSVDIKTTRDASADKFKWSMRDLGYWLQDAHYTAGIESHYGVEVERFLFVAVQTSDHYPCRLFEFSPAMRATARERRNELMAELQACIASGDWSDPGEDVPTSVDFTI